MRTWRRRLIVGAREKWAESRETPTYEHPHVTRAPNALGVVTLAFAGPSLPAVSN
jgi:hypothetical protein